MSAPKANPEIGSDPLEKLVAEHLDRSAEAVDAAGHWRRLQRRLAEPELAAEPAAPPDRPRRSGGLRLRWGLALAASLLILALGALSFTPSAAQAETLVREAEVRQRLEVDRTYAVRSELFGDFRERFPLLAQSGFERIHVRGGRFWVEAQKPGASPALLPRRGLRWGRDAQGRYWLSPAMRLGLRFEPNEVPEALSFFIAVRGAQAEELLKALLADFDLAFDRGAGVGPGFVKIRATLKPGRSAGTLKSAELTIRQADRELEELTLDRVFLGRPFARIHLKREADQPQAEENYRLETHLMKGGVVLDHADAGRRSEAFRALLSELKRGGKE